MAVAVPTVKTGRSCRKLGQAATALRLVSSVAITCLGTCTCLVTIDKTGATTGARPSAVSLAAVSEAPGSGRVINTRFKGTLFSKGLRSMICGASRAVGYPKFLHVSTKVE
jgi:hypothetical protein